MLEDQRPELLLKQEMDLTKRKVNGQAPSIERLRAYVRLEDQEQDKASKGALRDTDYELVLRSDEA